MLFYSTFPFLFLLGCGLESHGSVPVDRVRHMMFQFSGRFPICVRLIFLLFDQLQRHAASRVIASRVKCNPTSFDEFAKWVNDPAFAVQLEEASKNPTAESSILLLKKINVHIKSCTTRIPFTAAQRAASLMNLIAMQYMFGLPSIFFTYAPDDVNGILNLRLSLPQKGNSEFPADGTGFPEAIINNDATFHQVPIAPHNLRILLARGPVSAAEIFRLLTEAVFSILLGTPTEHSSKRTVPLSDRKAGVFGTPVASFGCVEEQARGSLHLHVVYWGSLPTQLLQTSATYPALIAAVAKALDNIISAEIDPIIQVEQLVKKFHGISSPKPSLSTAHHPVHDPIKFNEDVQKTVAICNTHNHSHTCRAGKVGKKSCRMRRPQPIVDKTMCTQIEPYIDPDNGQRSFNIVAITEQPAVDSQRCRNISRLPIPVRDKRLIMWEIVRRSIAPIDLIDDSSSMYINFL